MCKYFLYYHSYSQRARRDTFHSNFHAQKWEIYFFACARILYLFLPARGFHVHFYARASGFHLFLISKDSTPHGMMHLCSVGLEMPELQLLKLAKAHGGRHLNPTPLFQILALEGESSPEKLNSFRYKMKKSEVLIPTVFRSTLESKHSL